MITRLISQPNTVSIRSWFRGTLVTAAMLTGVIADVSADRPNVLFIVADDLRTDLGCYGNAELKTPHLDSLARSGLLFERAYCQQAVCGPSRSSVLSGARPDSTGIYQNSIRIRESLMPDLVTLPQLYRENGYTSLSVGKIYHHEEVETGGDVSTRPGDDPLSWSEAPWYHGDPYEQWFKPASHALMERYRALPADQRRRVVRGPAYEGAVAPDEVYPDGQIASKAIQVLNRVKDQPFFLAVGFRRPHLPLNAPQKYWDLYPPETIRLPDNHYFPEHVPDLAVHNSYELRSYVPMPSQGDIPEEEALNLIRAYKACTSFLDAQIGRLLTELDRLQLADDTIVIFWSDHGYHLGENGLWTKMTNFDVATRTPMIVRVPGRHSRGGDKTNALVELVDIYPSLAELCGLELPSHLEGTSFAPLIAEPDRSWKPAVFSQYPRRVEGKYRPSVDPVGYSMRTERYRYTEWTTPNEGVVATELYDLENDPAENHNVVGRAGHQDLVKMLAAKLHAGWQAARPQATSNHGKE